LDTKPLSQKRRSAARGGTPSPSLDTGSIVRGAAAFAVTLTGLLAGAVGLAAYAARRAASVDVAGDGNGAAGGTVAADRSPRPLPLAPADPMVDPRPAVGGPGRAEQPPAMAAAVNEAAEHDAPDLSGDQPVTKFTRAPEAFRPDPTAVPTAEEREALRPATGPAPSLSADRGDFAQGLAEADR